MKRVLLGAVAVAAAAEQPAFAVVHRPPRRHGSNRPAHRGALLR